MAITVKEVQYVARLARLALTPEETELFAGQLGHILEHMEQLKRLDTSRVPPTSHVLGLTNVLREDAAAPSPCGEALLANAPEREGNFFKVPKVIE